MTHSFSEFSTDAYFNLGTETTLHSYKQAKKIGSFTFIVTLDAAAHFIIDGLPVSLAPHSILSLTPLQNFEYVESDTLRVYQFNREFYCIKDHDKEVGCAGLLFFGNVHIPIVSLDKKEQQSFSLLHAVLLEELEHKDTIQAEMLRILMARFIIKTTRILKASITPSEVKDSKNDLLRNFNYLVETHFRKEHSVGFYAELLFKSPKTLSNAFAKLGASPLKIIHERIVLETKRMLLYTEHSTKEIAFELGFEDSSHLSRLFKKVTGSSPTLFKENSYFSPKGKN